MVAGLAEKAGKALELGLNVSTANILPLGTIAKQARQRKAAEKFQRETLEPLCEVYRAESRQEVEKDVREWTKKKGLPRIKTDY